MQIKTIPLWTVDVYKIHIKEWALIKDKFLSIIPWDDINQRKNKSARLNFDKINFKSNKTNFLIDLLKLEKGEHLENCFRLENFIN